MRLALDLADFDGKSTAVLEDALARTPGSAEVVDELVMLIMDPDKNIQTGASWLLRAYARDGTAVSADQIGRLAAALGEMHDGFGRLHLCQAMDHLEIPEMHAEAFADFFRSCRETSNTFLRAWAPHGFFRLALQHAVYRGEAVAAVEKALGDPAPSVRARARKTLAGG